MRDDTHVYVGGVGLPVLLAAQFYCTHCLS